MISSPVHKAKKLKTESAGKEIWSNLEKASKSKKRKPISLSMNTPVQETQGEPKRTKRESSKKRQKNHA